MKAAIESLTRYQAQELGARKIRVNTLAPGAITTDFGGGVVRDNEQLKVMIAKTTALGRVGKLGVLVWHSVDSGNLEVKIIRFFGDRKQRLGGRGWYDDGRQSHFPDEPLVCIKAQQLYLYRRTMKVRADGEA